jgi:hypothetical protein
VTLNDWLDLTIALTVVVAVIVDFFERTGR